MYAERVVTQKSKNSGIRPREVKLMTFREPGVQDEENV